MVKNKPKNKGKQKNLIIFIIVIAVIIQIILVIRLVSGEDDWICVNNDWVKHGQPKTPKPTKNCGPVSKTNINNPKTNTNINEEKNIVVTEPEEGETVTLPFTVKGKARVFENIVNFRVKEATGAVLFEGPTTAQSPDIDQFGNFEKEINYLTKIPKDHELTLEVLWFSPKDGKEDDLVTWPLKLSLEKSKTIKVFFNQNNNDATCQKVYSFDRITYETQTPARLALEFLLAGPMSSEVEKGYYTNINQGVKINSLSIENGIAKADFNETLEEGIGGSCKVSIIRAQITETLKQFPTVKEVVISINKRTADILQP